MSDTTDQIAIGLESAADHLRAGEKPADIAVRLREMADELGAAQPGGGGCLECQDTGYLEPVEFGAKADVCPHCQAAREEERGRPQPILDNLLAQIPRPLNPVDQLAIQTSYASIAFVAAHLRRYFEAYEEAGTQPDIPKTTLDAADRAAGVLDRMRQGDGSEWEVIAETMTRAAYALEFLLLGHPEGPHPAFRDIAPSLREAVEWMRAGSDAPSSPSAAYRTPAERLAEMAAGGER